MLLSDSQSLYSGKKHEYKECFLPEGSAGLVNHENAAEFYGGAVCFDVMKYVRGGVHSSVFAGSAVTVLGVLVEVAKQTAVG